jgi:hypothetical protein
MYLDVFITSISLLRRNPALRNLDGGNENVDFASSVEG